MDPNSILGIDVTRKRWGDVDTSEQKDLVLVTGASSFIGSHIIKMLLEQGYQVRGTLSSLKDEAIVSPVKNLVQSPKFDLELVEIDLLKPDCWREPIKDCKYIIHTAAPYPDEPVFGNEVDTTDLSVNAMSNLLNSILK